MKFVIGTKNPGKMRMVQAVAESIFSEGIVVEGRDVPSGVPDAPIDEDTFNGARNRAIACSEQKDADYFLGLESGLVERYGQFFEEAWVVVISKDGQRFAGYSSGLMLPEVVVRKMKSGQLHNDIMLEYDKRFNRPDDRDTWARYTGGGLSRQVSFEEAIRNAFIQLHDSEQNLYKLND